jgi:hypothetical protein
MYERSLLSHSLFSYGTKLAMACIGLLFILCIPAPIPDNLRVEAAVFFFILSFSGTMAARSVIDMHHLGLGSNYGRRCASCGLPLVLEKSPRTVPGGLRAPAPWPNVSMLACVQSEFAYGHTRKLVRVRG